MKVQNEYEGVKRRSKTNRQERYEDGKHDED